MILWLTFLWSHISVSWLLLNIITIWRLHWISSLLSDAESWYPSVMMSVHHFLHWLLWPAATRCFLTNAYWFLDWFLWSHISVSWLSLNIMTLWRLHLTSSLLSMQNIKVWLLACMVLCIGFSGQLRHVQHTITSILPSCLRYWPFNVHNMHCHASRTQPWPCKNHLAKIQVICSWVSWCACVNSTMML